MSNSPDDPRLIPGHPEFVQRPADWKKTVAKQICEISRLERDLAAANAEQKRDGERLDWLENRSGVSFCQWDGGTKISLICKTSNEMESEEWHESLRQAIDAAMSKEATP